jgi:DNA-binding MarR family transcriptional regulator
MATATKAGKNDAAQIYQRTLPWVLITEIYWMSYKLLERRFYHLGVSASQARVLAVLHFTNAPIKPSLVATLLFQETQSITGILHRIESRGWVRRLPDPNDRRAVGLELTDRAARSRARSSASPRNSTTTCSARCSTPPRRSRSKPS